MNSGVIRRLLYERKKHVSHNRLFVKYGMKVSLVVKVCKYTQWERQGLEGSRKEIMSEWKGGGMWMTGEGLPFSWNPKHYVLCAHLFNKHSMIYVLRTEGKVGEGVRGETRRGSLGWVAELRPLLKVI